MFSASTVISRHVHPVGTAAAARVIGSSAGIARSMSERPQPAVAKADHCAGAGPENRPSHGPTESVSTAVNKPSRRILPRTGCGSLTSPDASVRRYAQGDARPLALRLRRRPSRPVGVERLRRDPHGSRACAVPPQARLAGVRRPVLAARCHRLAHLGPARADRLAARPAASAQARRHPTTRPSS